MSRAAGTGSIRCRLLVSFLLLLAGSAGAEALNDPTRPPARAPAPRPGAAVVVARERLVLSSVLISPERRVAVINGRALQVGERIDDAEVVAIDLQQVRLKRHTQTVTLTLSGKNGVVKHPENVPGKGQKMP